MSTLSLHPHTSHTVGNKSYDTNKEKSIAHIASLDDREFDTPEPTIKMAHFSPNISPTTENKMFSGACLSIRMLDSLNGIDLNASSFEADYHNTSQPKKIALRGPFSLSHWEMNLKLPVIQQEVVTEFLEWLLNTNSKKLQGYKLF